MLLKIITNKREIIINTDDIKTQKRAGTGTNILGKKLRKGEEVLEILENE